MRLQKVRLADQNAVVVKLRTLDDVNSDWLLGEQFVELGLGRVGVTSFGLIINWFSLTIR